MSKKTPLFGKSAEWMLVLAQQVTYLEIKLFNN